ncbi:MAG: V-type ATPase subunit [Oscillospiraceae bacterium]|nr:V-type ATPase subunit [Oscillospiraceae bacterium]
MSIASNNAVITKSRALYGKRLTNEQYDDLVKCKSVPEIATYLKTNTIYSKALENINEVAIHRGQLEVLLQKEAFNNYARLYHYLNKTEDNLFHFIIEEFELQEILRMILLLKANSPKDFIVSLPGFLISRCHIDLLGLAKVRSYDELLNFLRGTDYYDILIKFKPTKEEPHINYVSCEHSLYERFFKRLFNLVHRHTKGTERLELKRVFGIRLDHLNICSIYRSKVLFKDDPEKIKQRIFPFHRLLSKEKIDEIISATTDEQVINLLKNLFVSKNIINKVAKNEKFYIESYASRLNYRICKNYLHISKNVSTVFYAFYTLSQIEISNLIYIIEGVRYKIPSGEIEDLLIR